MNKISAVIALLLFISLNNYSQEKEPARPDNIPSYAQWDMNGWKIYDRITIRCNTVRWYPDGKIWAVNSITDDRQFEIIRYFYGNGNKKYVENNINYDYYEFLYRKKRKFKRAPGINYIGKFQEYYENGKLKIDKYYKLVINETEEEVNIRTELCGDETYYDENGNVTKKISHGGECPEYNFPELTAEEVIEKMEIKSFQRRFGFLPEVGKLKDKNTGEEIIVSYKSGFELNKGDCIVWKDKTKLLYFICERNEGNTGYFKLVSEDKYDKYKTMKKGDPMYFFHGNYLVDRKEIGRKNRRKGEVITVGDIEFVYVPGGEKTVEVEGVKKRIRVKSFWISKYEMTEGAYQKYRCELFSYMFHEVKEETFSSRYPVNLGGNSTSTTQYLSWFTEKYKVKARLAQPNEWIYAASGGTEWQKKMKENIKEYAWYSENSGGEVHKVGEKEANDYGLYDMNGNAWEWVSGSNLIGGSYKSSKDELTGYRKVYADVDYWADVSRGSKEKAPWSKQTETCTSFRVVIEAE